jgi:hypothetical protein
MIKLEISIRRFPSQARNPKQDVSEKSGEPNGIIPSTPVIPMNHPGADAVRLT